MPCPRNGRYHPRLLLLFRDYVKIKWKGPRYHIGKAVGALKRKLIPVAFAESHLVESVMDSLAHLAVYNFAVDVIRIAGIQNRIQVIHLGYGGFDIFNLWWV